MKLCLGTAQLGQQYGIRGNDQPSRESSMALLKTAIVDYGITMLDTAVAYGDSEHIIGLFFERQPECKRASVITKLPSFSDVSPGSYLETAREFVENSLRRLSLESLDGLLLHDERDCENPLVVNVLQKLKEIGLVRHIGVSVYEPSIALFAAQSEAMEYIQVPYNALDRRLETNGFFTQARLHGKIVFARSVFLQGLLVMEDIPIPRAKPYVRSFQRICAQHGMTPAQGCVYYAAANENIDFLVVGIDHPEELLENARLIAQPVNQSFIDEVRTEIDCNDCYVLMPRLWKRV